MGRAAWCSLGGKQGNASKSPAETNSLRHHSTAAAAGSVEIYPGRKLGLGGLKQRRVKVDADDWLVAGGARLYHARPSNRHWHTDAPSYSIPFEPRNGALEVTPPWPPLSA